MDNEDAYMQARQSEKDIAIAEIALLLDQLTEQRRDPDHWERVHLAHSLASVFSGCYGLAAVEARLAMTPIDQRSPSPQLPNDPFFGQCDLPLLTRALREAMAEPLRRFPHLGPIVFTGAPP